MVPVTVRGGAVSFKANADCRHHIAKQWHRATNSAAYDGALPQLGRLIVWATGAAIVSWKAQARATRGGRPRYSDLAIATAPGVLVERRPMRESKADPEAEIMVLIDGAHIRAAHGYQSRRLDVTVGKIEVKGTHRVAVVRIAVLDNRLNTPARFSMAP